MPVDSRTQTGGQDEIEILTVRLLSEHRPTVTRLRRLAGNLRLGLGWHYLLDLVWILDRMRPRTKTVLDAGAGLGVMQWYLSGRGLRVISVDRGDRAQLPVRLRSRYHVTGIRPEDLEPIRLAIYRELRAGRNPIRSAAHQVRNIGELVTRVTQRGEVVIYNQDLRSMTDIPDNSIDAVVAVSALEHNSPFELDAIVRELMRVLRPGGRLIATLGAARDEDWFHEPSQGWCYSEDTLRRIFGIDSPRTNFGQYDLLLAELRDCAELRDNLASFYYQSGANGMPWGVWDPQYQSVGVCKTKPEAAALPA